MTERDFEMRRAFVRDIAARPADDAPRLIYADWLMDRPDEPIRMRGEFIRLTVECEALLVKAVGDGAAWQCRHSACKDDACPICTRRKRALALLNAANDWQDERPLCFRPRVMEPWGLRSPVRWARGFVAMVYCTCKEWLRWGPELAALHPVEYADLTNKSPARLRVDAPQPDDPDARAWRWSWRLGGNRKSSLPEKLFRHLAAEGEQVEYPDSEQARNALMVGAARFARLAVDKADADEAEMAALLDELEDAA